ncbi:hypothetical protein VTI74DRAFT_7498 [Chaetomium olivicolor]
MCFTIRLLYACAYDPALAEPGCQSSKGRKESLYDDRILSDRSTPVIRYCPDRRDRSSDSELACPHRIETCEALEEIVYPLKCPVCWAAFISRLCLSRMEKEMIRQTQFEDNRGWEINDETLEIDLGWVVEDYMDGVVDKCVMEKIQLEKRWDAAVLEAVEALPKDTTEGVDTRGLVTLPFTGLDYGSYERKKQAMLDLHRARRSPQQIAGHGSRLPRPLLGKEVSRSSPDYETGFSS